jgi:hypothetical protein
VQFGDAYGKQVDDVLEMMYKYSKKKDMNPFSCARLAMLNTALATTRVVDIREVPQLIDVDASRWVAADWAALKEQLLRFTRSMLVRHLGTTYVLSHADTDTGDVLGKFKDAVQLAVLTVPELQKVLLLTLHTLLIPLSLLSLLNLLRTLSLLSLLCILKLQTHGPS